MGAELATLAMKVENADVVQATTALNNLTVAGGKSEAAATRLTRRMALLEIQAREMDASMRTGGAAMAAMEAEAHKLDAELAREARAMALVEIEARKMDAALTASKQAAFTAEVRKTADAEARLAETIRRTDAQMEKMGKTGTTSFSAIRSAFTALATGLVVREFIQLSDTYTNLHSRLRLVTTGTANLNAVQAELFATAQRTRSSFEGTADLYSKIARNAATLGVSQRDVLSITETISKAMIISGGSAQANEAALTQLGQAFASGTLRGEELNSVMEQSPRLAQAIAEGLGVPIGKLREMGKEGDLTADMVVKALMKMRGTIDREFSSMPATIAGAWQTLRNEILNTVGAANEAGGMSGGIVTAINAIRDAIPPAFKLVNAFFGGISIGSADAAVGLEKLRQKTGQLQMALGLMLQARSGGTSAIGKVLVDNAAKVLKDGDDILRMLEAQREEVIKNVHAITEAGTVSTVAPPGGGGGGGGDDALKARKKLMDELRAAVEDVARAQMDADIAATKSSADAVASIEQQRVETELLLAAAEDSEEAYKAQQREIDVLNKLTQAGITLGDERYEQVKREIEQTYDNVDAIKAREDAWKKEQDAAKKAADEAKRDQEHRNRDIRRSTVANIEGILTDISNKRNPLIALAEGFKRAMIRAISDALAERFLQSRFAAMLGIGVEGAAKKQDSAALKMLAAAKAQNDAADKMLRAVGIKIDANDPQKKVETKVPAWVGPLIKGFGVALAAGYGGFQAGQAVTSTSHGTAGNLVRGALSGAVTGAVAGGAVAGLPGAIAGAVIGFVSGMFGASKAMKEAAKAAEEMRKALSINMASLRAEVGKDALAANIAAVEAQREQLRKQIEDAYSGGDRNSATVRERNRQLAELNRLEDLRIQQLREEAAVLQQRQIEDYQARLDAATPGNEREEAIAANNRKLDRELEDLRLSFGSVIDAAEAQTFAVAQAAIAAEKEKFARDQSTASLNAFTNAVKNAPSGFKIDRYLWDITQGIGRPPGQFQVPTNPFVPPMSPLGGPTLSRSTTERAAPMQVTFNINGSKLSSDEITRAVVKGLDQFKATTAGPNTTRGSALEAFR